VYNIEVVISNIKNEKIDLILISSYGLLLFADVKELDNLPKSEIERI